MHDQKSEDEEKGEIGDEAYTTETRKEDKKKRTKKKKREKLFFFFLWDQHFIRKKHLINLGRLKNQREGINTLNDPAAKRPLSLDPDLRDRNTTAHLRATSAPIEGRV